MGWGAAARASVSTIGALRVQVHHLLTAVVLPLPPVSPEQAVALVAPGFDVVRPLGHVVQGGVGFVALPPTP